MRLHEIANTRIEQACNDVAEYVCSNDRPPTLDSSVDFMLNNLPECAYGGNMYRALMFDVDTFRTNRSTQLLLSELQRHAQAQDSDRYCCWSKSEVGMRTAVSNNMDAALYKGGSEIFVVLSQHGTALDVGAVMRRHPDHTEQYGLLFREQELIARMNNSVHVTGFVVMGGTRPRSFGVDQYREFLRAIDAM